MELSIIIPTYNEKENISKLIDLVENVLSGVDYEIIVVDDNSPDGTAEIVEALNIKYNNISIIRRPSKLGLASAILAGFEASKGDAIAVIDADLQHPPELLPKMLNELAGGKDLVIASRYSLEGGIKDWNIFRKIISKNAIYLTHLFLPSTRNVRDPVSGYFMVRRELIKGLRFEAAGYKLLAELLVKRPEAKVTEIPYIFKPRQSGRSKLKVSDYYLYGLLCLKLSGYRPLKFALVGVSGIGVNEGFLHILMSLGKPVFLGSPLAIELSILNNFVWNELWTFGYKRKKGIVKRCLKFHGASLIGGLVNYIILLSLSRIGLSYLIANLAGILMGFVFNYIFSEVYVWRRGGGD